MASRALNIGRHKRAISDPDKQTAQPKEVEEAAIAARAYECWQERGCPIGSDQEDWFKAEAELRAGGMRRPNSA